MVRNFFYKTIHLAPWGTAQGPTAMPHGVRGASNTVASATAVGHGGRGQVCFQKFYFFCLNSDEGKLYMKIVSFDEIYNFVVQSFAI
jgi:hypothetical protein